MIDLAPFVGRFHPLLVHFPIGILLLAIAMQLLASFAARRRRANAAHASNAAHVANAASAADAADVTNVATIANSAERAGEPQALIADRAIAFVLACGALSAVVAATTGYLLGGSGGYTGATFERHETLGIGVAIVSCVAALIALLRLLGGARAGERSALEPGSLPPGSFPFASFRGSAFWRGIYAGTLAVLFVMLTWAGHLGATLTHGEGYLTEHAPAPLRTLLARLGLDVGTPASAARPSADQALVFASLVEPVLQARCVQCHGAAKMEGDLRLDGPDGLRKGGKSGPVLVAGVAAKSEIVRRIWLPASDVDVMPPRGQRPLTPAEASLIRWWIDRGAKFDQKVIDAEAQITPDVRPAIEAIVGPIPIDFGGPTLPKVKIAPAAPAALSKVRATGVAIVPVSATTPFVHVHCTNVRATFGDQQLAALEAIAPQILWLDLSGTQITDAGLAVVEKLPNLTRLHLNRTAITDAGLTHLARASHLEYLNLYGTKITDAGLSSLAALPSLRALYLWQTAATPQGIERLKTALPQLVVY